ncbi:hypothetical protein O181_049368 [Austropuccinia psidii MF-1]|uniref:SET domain-containing protein n=1 Tax=Austropuccinia psidii MF-1 TaxID=1389203 RepID=A0A9Q3DZR1_9BASI|nr:hypothetical protein [Austropuccinia psidii MF-1]
MAQAVIKANQKSKSKTAPATDGQSFSDEGSCDQQISNVPSAAVRALGRLLWNKQREEEKDPNWWIGLDELQSQLNVYNSSQKERLMQLSVILSRYVGTQLLLDILSSASTLLPFCCRFLDNTFTLTSTTLDNIGVVFCPSASFINHSCVPNVVVVYPEGGEGASKKVGKEWVKVIAIKNIEPGEEVVTSYVDLAGTRKERQNELAQRYQFICHCSLCKSDWLDQVDPREALKCPKCTNWFSLPPSKCNYHDVPQACGSVDASSPNRSDAGPSSGGGVKKEITCPNCGFSRLIDVEGQRLAIKKSGQALDTVKEPAKAAYYAEKAIEWFQMKLLPFTFGPGFYPILELRRMKMVSHLLCKNEQNLKQARAETQQIISGIHLIYGVGHPVSIITKSTIAKLCGWTWRSTIEQNKLESSEHNQDGSKHGNGREREEIELGLKMLEILKQYQCLALEECVIGFGMANGGGRLGRSISHSIQCTEHEITIRKRILKAA